MIKNILLAFCVAFTIVTLLSSFTKAVNGVSNTEGDAQFLQEVSFKGQQYILATTRNGGIAICKK